MSFLKDIEKLAQPVFQLPDLEDEDVDGLSSHSYFLRTPELLPLISSDSGTSSRAISKTKYTEDDDGMPKLRRKVIALDVGDSSKYGGTKVSRGDIFDDFSGMTGLADHSTGENGHLSDDGDESNGSGDEEESEDDEEEENDFAERDAGEDDEEEDDELEDEHESGEDGVPTTSVNSGDDDTDSEEGSEESGEEQEEQQASDSEKAKAMTLQDLMKNVDKDKQQRKAESVRAQSEIWEQLLYVKIKLHAALTAFNQLPRGQLAKNLLKEADEETAKNLKLAQKNALKLVSTLLEAESFLLGLSTFTKSINEGKEGDVDSDDEEIESSEDEKDDEDDNDIGDEEQEESDGAGSGASQTLPMNIKSLSKRLCESEEKFTKFRNSTLIKWDERTKLISSRRPKNANTDFSAFEKENIVTQIEKAEEDEEIFDDDDFYQVLLKELIDKKTSNTQDPVAMTRHYIEMQKLKSRRSKKKYVDHRASKDRKIKYLPIPKLVNFHPAMPEMVEWSHESRNELFKSLFS
ncbi:TRAUB domain protein [Ancylostoma duodenale]|uniref:TRAUB domain protein n=1 Tax=Ancylostoma duodenale TaxID=51022 RepID=A0A0C2CRN8_9BILA|nr:TRAUB domain protein [Ancylostoma duodenale]